MRFPPGEMFGSLDRSWFSPSPPSPHFRRPPQTLSLFPPLTDPVWALGNLLLVRFPPSLPLSRGRRAKLRLSLPPHQPREGMASIRNSGLISPLPPLGTPAAAAAAAAGELI